MNNTFKIISISFAVGVLSLGAYFLIGNKAEGQADPLLTSEVTNKAVGIPDLSTNTDQTVQLILSNINDLDQIKLNVLIFEKPEFLALKDISQELPPPTDIGRPNPFAPIGTDVGVISTDGSPADTMGFPTNMGTQATPSAIKTKEIINIGRTSATANAEISLLGITSHWFEYGTNENTVNKTTKQTSSDVAFSATLTNLLPKTTYFVKSAVDQNGVVAFGDLVSFTTAQ